MFSGMISWFCDFGAELSSLQLCIYQPCFTLFLSKIVYKTRVLWHNHNKKAIFSYFISILNVILSINKLLGKSENVDSLMFLN